MTPSLKLFIINDIRYGHLSMEDAIRLYDLSREELQMWQNDYYLHGFDGLKIKTLGSRRKKAA